MTSGKQLNVAFVGAGAVNFGGAEGPWDHASRIERMQGISVQAIVDPFTERSREVLATRKKGCHSSLYQDCAVYASSEELFASKKRIDAVIVGTPPFTRGTMASSQELKYLAAGIHMFVEKPLAVVPPEEFNSYAKTLNETAQKNQLVLSVGYMFRYHAAVMKMKELIAAHGGKVISFNGRYYNAYSEMRKNFWWDVSLSGGPIVEQATHFCDLARYLCGDIKEESIQATCLRGDDPSEAGKLSHFRHPCEDGIPEEKRPPRVCTAMWRFEEGGVGTIMHTIALHGKKYESHIDVLMDGLRMTLYEPYHPECTLRVRKSGSDEEVVTPYGDDDPYKRELDVFFDAVSSGNAEGVKSPYSDAAKTYNFTWAIRRAYEKQ